MARYETNITCQQDVKVKCKAYTKQTKNIGPACIAANKWKVEFLCRLLCWGRQQGKKIWTEYIQQNRCKRDSKISNFIQLLKLRNDLITVKNQLR